MAEGNHIAWTDEDLGVLLSLAAATGGRVESCPGPARVAAWHDDTLNEREVRALKRHLRVCTDCYRDWVALLEISDILSPGDAPARQPARPRPADWFARLGAQLRPLAAVAAGLAVLVVVWQVAMPPTGAEWARSVDEAYTAFTRITSADQRAKLVDASRWAWQPGLGSRSLLATEDGVGTTHGAARYAFAAGVRDGIEALAPDESQWQRIVSQLPDAPLCASHAEVARCDELDSLFVQLGRWTVVMHFACVGLSPNGEPEAGFGPAAAFWPDQASMLGEFERAAAQTVQGDPFQLFLTGWAESLPGPADERLAPALCTRRGALLTLGLN